MQHFNRVAASLAIMSDAEVLARLPGLCNKVTGLLEGLRCSPLHLAASLPGRAALVTTLLTLRPDDVIREDCENGWSPLHYAFFYGNLDSAKQLILVIVVLIIVIKWNNKQNGWHLFFFCIFQLIV